jgi:hypothetical protein
MRTPALVLLLLCAVAFVALAIYFAPKCTADGPDPLYIGHVLLGGCK